MNLVRSLLVLGLCWGASGAFELSAGEAERAAAKAKLAPLQAYVGQWKGVGQRERGKSEGAWLEKNDWAWKFAGDDVALAFAASDAKYLASGRLQPTDKDGEFRLTIQSAGEQGEVTYLGKLAEDKLVLDAESSVADLPARITLRVLAEGKRLVALYEGKSASGDRYVRLAEVGYTRVGSNFGKGTQGPECIVTGGLGTIAVTHNGKTYHVCCTGCQEYFNDDPQRVIDEYLERKKGESK